MAARPNQSPSVDVFDAYFRRADLDRDGKISGQEAVPFFQGSNLPKQVLAQIWSYANQSQTGYLGRPEFYNALRLITVAQSGRELTPDIVKAALYGPAAAKIPAPQITSVSASPAQLNSLATPTSQLGTMGPLPTQMGAMGPLPTQMGAMGPSALQSLGVRGQHALPNVGTNQQFFPSTNNHMMRPPQGVPTTAASHPIQGVGQGISGGVNVVAPHPPISNASNLSTDWHGGRPTGPSTGITSQTPVTGLRPPVSQDEFGLAQLGAGPGVIPRSQGSSSSTSSPQPKTSDPFLQSSPSAAKDSKTLVVSGNGFSSDFGGDVFSVTPQAKQEASTPAVSSVSMPNLASTVSGSQNSTKPGQSDSLQSTSALPPVASQLQMTQSLVQQNQIDAVQRASAVTSSNSSVGPATSASSQSQLSWPRITHSDVQKYTAVFVKVDKDRDGKITGEEARNLFLSWRLPREVLKQVWDLSDQDNDSMLSLREFCTAVYLMERFREGHPLPAMLPNSLKFDETLLHLTNQPSTAYSGSTWQQNPGLSHQRIPGSRPPLPSSGLKPHARAPIPPQTEDAEQPQQPKARVPVLEKHLVNQLSKEEQSALSSKFQEATDADKKVQELEKEILESKEKIEFYRTKMQELVLYKSRCDNRLNELTERVSADKREVETLAKKYEEKYKQVGGVASKLTLDEATFRDIQGRKLELYNAIAKMEQGDTADGVLQDRADRIQSDLDEVVKALNERCKQYGLHAKPTSLVELPFGWQPGIQEGAADWDENWDKFDDEGFVIVKELTIEVENVVAKPRSPPVRKDKSSANDTSAVPSSSNDDSKTEPDNPVSIGENLAEDDSAYVHSEDGSAKSPSGSPIRSTLESPSQELQSTHDISPRSKETQSEHGGAESTISGDKYFDEPSWGAKFDSNDDADSTWSFGTINTKETDHERSQNDFFFGGGDFGLNPIRTQSPSAANVFGTERKSPFFDSVPSTPLYNSSPRFNEGPEDHAFDRFSRFDSFSNNDSGFFPPRESSFERFDSMRSTADPPGIFARFDSMRSTADPPGTFTRFDSMRSTADPPGTFARFDSMRSTADPSPLGSLTRFDSMRSTTDAPLGSLARFDSIRSTTDYGRDFPSFDDADPFGSTGPFKSSEDHTPRRGTDHWSAF